MESKQVIGIIPDGSRKWAHKTGNELVQAYRQGANVAIEILKAAMELGNVGRVVFYALSHENFQRRPPEQVQAILAGIEKFLSLASSLPDVSVQCYGDHQPPEIARLAKLNIGSVAGRMHVDLLFHYSAGWDLETRPIRTASIPPLDAVIRTSGQTRLSGFLPWQSAYAQLLFTSTLWTDFTPKEFLGLMDLYRELRSSGITGA